MEIGNIMIDSMHGIGDNLYQRPMVKELCKLHPNVYIKTSLPWMYNDIPNLKILPPPETYRTQAKSLKGYKGKYTEPLSSYDHIIKPFYTGANLSKSTIIHCLEDAFDLKMLKYEMSMPRLPKKSGVDWEKLNPENKPVAIIRPPTVRTEWHNATRNCDPKYTNWAAYTLKRSGWFVVSVADLKEGVETIVGAPPPADLYLHEGELGLKNTLTLFKEADVIISCVGFVLPAAIAAKTPLFMIFGGRGLYDVPYKLFDLRMDLRNVSWAVPDNHCLCSEIEHDCDKRISNFDSKFFEFMARIKQE